MRLFHKALRLCDRDPRYKYNLGLAYYRYGNAQGAEKYLAVAVKQDGNWAVWLHDLANVMLENGSNSSKALKYAEKAYRLGKDDSSLGPLVVETYARAQLATGEGLAAIKVIEGGRSSWPQDKSLVRIAGELELYPLAGEELSRESFKVIVRKQRLDFSFLKVAEGRIFAGAEAAELKEVLDLLKNAKGYSETSLNYMVGRCR